MNSDQGESYRHGFENALELCIGELNEAENKEKAMAKMMEVFSFC